MSKTKDELQAEVEKLEKKVDRLSELAASLQNLIVEASNKSRKEIELFNYRQMTDESEGDGGD